MRFSKIVFISLAFAALIGCAGKKGSYSPLLQYEEGSPLILIQNVRIFDGLSPELSEAQDVTIDKGRIVAVSEPGSRKAGGDLQTINGEGKVLMPGLIDAHIHLAGSGSVPWEPIKPDVGYNLQAYLYAGITSVYELGGLASQAKKLRKRLNAGKSVGPNLYFTHAPITVDGSHPIPLGEETAPWPLNKLLKRVIPTPETKEEAEKTIARYKKMGVDYVKLICDQIPNGSPEMGAELMGYLVDAAHREGLKVFAHIGSPQNMMVAVGAGVDVLAHGVYKEELEIKEAGQLAKAGIPMVYTLSGFENVAQFSEGSFEPDELHLKLVPEEVLAPISGEAAKHMPQTGVMHDFVHMVGGERKHWKQNFARLQEAGVPIRVGTDSALPGTYPGATYHQELRLLHEYGLSIPELLIAATSGNATLFLEKPDFGRVEVGCRADLLLLNGNPLEDLQSLQNPEMIMVRGQIVKKLKP